jgi:hypothetical protein
MEIQDSFLQIKDQLINFNDYYIGLERVFI